MGQEGSIQAPQYTVKDGFERDQFQKQHNANHIDFALQQLSSIGTDLSKISPKVPIPMAVPHPKILFIICNTYTTEQYKLGSGPVNDSVAVASFLKQLGYTIFYLHNANSKIFIEWFRHILKNATLDLILFFAGYAITPKGEETGNAILFDDDCVKDEELGDLISQCRGPKQRTVLLSDCCHSGTLWNLQNFKKEAPQNVMSISPTKDSESLDSKDQGIFTFYFWKIWFQNQSITIKQMKEEIAAPLSKYNLHLDYYLTTPELENQPIFTKPEETPNKPAPKLSLKPAAKSESQPKRAAAPAKTEAPATQAEKPKVTERTAPAPQETKEEEKKEPAPATPAPPKEEEKKEPAAKEEAPAQPKEAAKEEAPAQPEPAKEEKSSSDEDDKSSDDEDKKDKKEKSSSDDDDKSSDDEYKKDKKEKSSSDDDDKSSDDEDKKDKKEKSSSDEDDKSSDDEDDKSD